MSSDKNELYEIIYLFLPVTMKKVTILFFTITLMLLTACTNSDQQTDSIQPVDNQKSTSTIWSSINETTWWKDNGWAGETYVFYTDNQNAKKCIHQIEGSGVYITSRRFVDFEIIDDNKIKIENAIYSLSDNKLISEDTTLTLHSKEPLVYNHMCGPIDIESVKSNEFVVEDIDQECENQKR